MKNNFYLLFVLSLFIFSCENDDDIALMEETTFNVTAAPPNVSEDGGVVTFTFDLPIATQLDIYNFELLGTASGDDYETPDFSFSVPVGENTAVVTFNVINDDVVEGAETVILEITERNGIPITSGTSNTATVTIDDDDSFPYQNGFLITNQGPFNNGFGSVSFADGGLTTVENNIYQTVNTDNLGNIVQSIGFTENNAYIVSNVSNRLTIVNRFTFEEITRINTGLSNPRFFVEANGKGYVTNWGDGANATDDYVAVIDLATNAIIGTIAVGEGPEEIIYNGTNIYITNQGGFGVNNIVTVIDPINDTVVTTIPVGDVPNGLELDAMGNLWVLSGGSPAFTGAESGGALSVINTSTNTISSSFDFEMTEHPNYINIEEENIYYYLNGEVFASSTTDFEIPTTSVLSGLSLFNMVVTGDTLVGANAGDFASNGTLEIYNLPAGTLTNTLNVGIVPEQIYFNE